MQSSKKFNDIESQDTAHANMKTTGSCEKVTFSYLLFWDILLVNPFDSGVQMESLTWFVPVVLTQVENVAMILIHWKSRSEGSNSQPHHSLWTIVSGSCLLLGWLFFSSSSIITSFARRRKNSFLSHESSDGVSPVMDNGKGRTVGNSETDESVVISTESGSGCGSTDKQQQQVMLMCQKLGELSKQEHNEKLRGNCASDEFRASDSHHCEQHIRKLGVVVKPNNHQTNISGTVMMARKNSALGIKATSEIKKVIIMP